VAVGADRIVAAPGTLTGSIGVVGGKIAVGGALEKVGVHTDVVSKGRNAGWLSMQTRFSDAEREAFLATMKDIYRLFTAKVAAGRKLAPERVAALAEGRVFTGRMAKELGLVDRLGTLDDAIAEAKSLAGIPEDQPVERLLLPEPRGLFDELFGMGGAGGGPMGRLAAAAAPQGQFSLLLERLAAVPGFAAVGAEAGALMELATGRPLMLLPARVRLR
jgi:protease-4